MGIYIDGMEMPRTCRECAYCWVGLKSCDAKYGLPVGERWDIERASFCPLTEVPEPHGPLVDEDLIRERAKYWLVGGTDGHTLNDFLNEFLNVAEITTVIERSE